MTLIARFIGANMGPIWNRQDPGGPHVGPMNFAIWEVITIKMDNRIIHIKSISSLAHVDRICKRYCLFYIGNEKEVAY